MIGKPYSGKLNVRFDEGELEIEPSATTPALYSTPWTHKNRSIREEGLREGCFLRQGRELSLHPIISHKKRGRYLS